MSSSLSSRLASETPPSSSLTDRLSLSQSGAEVEDETPSPSRTRPVRAPTVSLYPSWRSYRHTHAPKAFFLSPGPGNRPGMLLCLKFGYKGPRGGPDGSLSRLLSLWWRRGSYPSRDAIFVLEALHLASPLPSPSSPPPPPSPSPPRANSPP